MIHVRFLRYRQHVQQKQGGAGGSTPNQGTQAKCFCFYSFTLWMSFKLKATRARKASLLHSRRKPQSLISCILKVLIERPYFIFFFPPDGMYPTLRAILKFTLVWQHDLLFICNTEARFPCGTLSTLVKLSLKWYLQWHYKAPSVGSILQSLPKHEERGADDCEIQGEVLQMVTSSWFNRKTSVVKELINYSLKSR